MKKKLFKEILINFLAWWVGVTFIVVTESLLQYWDEPAAKQVIHWNALAGTAAVIAVFSVCHYYILYVHFFQKRKYVQYVLLCLLFLLILAILDGIILYGIFDGFRGLNDNFIFAFRVGFLRGAALYSPAAIFYSLIKGNLGLMKQKKELENQQLQSSIAALQSQLTPHFLFNTLNTIYATAKREQAVRTASSVEELADLFRYSIEEAGEEKVSIEKELSFIDKYIQLQRLRIDNNDKVDIDVNIDWDKQPVQIAPMLLLPFIENAFKYGVSYQAPSRVAITLAVKQGELTADIVNTNHADKVQTPSTGIGKGNALSRLQLQYANKHSFKEEKENGHYKVSLTIQL